MIKNIKKDCIDFLDKHDYLTTVYINNDSIELKMPEVKTKYINRSKTTISFEIKRGKKSQITIKNVREEVVPIPQYAIRLYITAIIARYCGTLGFDIDMVSVYKEGKNIGVGIDDLINSIKPPKKLQAKKERALNQIIEDSGDLGIMDGYDEIAMEYDVFDGFLLLKSLREGELV